MEPKIDQKRQEFRFVRELREKLRHKDDILDQTVYSNVIYDMFQNWARKVEIHEKSATYTYKLPYKKLNQGYYKKNRRSARKPVRAQFLEIIGALVKLSRLGHNLDQILKEKIFSKVPFQTKGSYGFMSAAKNGDIETMKKLLKFEKYIIYDFDHTNQQALHWAVKAGHIKTVLFLLNHGADPDH